MERDLVDRLRAMAGPIVPNVCTEAADEIERLREQLRLANIDNFNTNAEASRLQAEIERLRAGGCARDQRTTQYCAEAVRLQADIERIRSDQTQASVQFLAVRMALLDRLDAMKRERDDARRLCCQIESDTDATVAKRIAVQRGWDCFWEAGK